jgi:DNA-binding CsgD family transcriptional regulator
MHAGRGHPKVRNWKEVADLYEQGHSTVELAKRFGVTPQAVWFTLKQLGLSRSRAEAQKLRSLKCRAMRQGGV